MLKGDSFIVVGAGFSGSLFAINALRYAGAHVTLIERVPDLVGQGVAYGTAQREHLLNVRAANMSALPDQPDHFVHWLERRHGRAGAGFAGRQTYGAYLSEMLEEMVRRAGDRIRIVQDEAVAVESGDDRIAVVTASGERVGADVAVLAPGNLPPHDLPPFVGLDSGLYVNDPWSADVARNLPADGIVLLLGTGLTAIDCVLTLDAAGFAGRIVALSRRGLLPRAHALSGPAPERQDRPPVSGSALIRHVRFRAKKVGWRSAVDELRPYTQDIWRSADVDERGRFLRHLRPYWDVHRHRIAPQVADRIAALQEQGRLSFVPGKVVDAREAGGKAHVRWRSRGSEEVQAIVANRVINCTGPQGDVMRTREPLLRDLIDAGRMRPDLLHLGIDVDAQGRIIGADGEANERLFALGPMTRGAHWEIVAVPDLRRQAWDLARKLTATHWVGGEGL